jgi:hypothetical protein
MEVVDFEFTTQLLKSVQLKLDGSSTKVGTITINRKINGEAILAIFEDLLGQLREEMSANVGMFIRGSSKKNKNRMKVTGLFLKCIGYNYLGYSVDFSKSSKMDIDSVSGSVSFEPVVLSLYFSMGIDPDARTIPSSGSKRVSLNELKTTIDNLSDSYHKNDLIDLHNSFKRLRVTKNRKQAKFKLINLETLFEILDNGRKNSTFRGYIFESAIRERIIELLEEKGLTKKQGSGNVPLAPTKQDGKYRASMYVDRHRIGNSRLRIWQPFTVEVKNIRGSTPTGLTTLIKMGDVNV